jgi:hypothetical protein
VYTGVCVCVCVYNITSGNSLNELAADIADVRLHECDFFPPYELINYELLCLVICLVNY